MAEHSTRQLILVKHSLPEIRRDVPASEWRLSDEGRDRCDALAACLMPLQPGSIVSSIEPKAKETGELVAQRLQRPFRTYLGLHEHDRTNVPVMEPGQFEKSVESFFRRPDELVFGRETAREAGARFSDAVDTVIRSSNDGNLVIVAHGTVISLYVAKYTGEDPYPLWRRLGFPSYVVLTLPGRRVEQIVPTVN